MAMSLLAFLIIAGLFILPLRWAANYSEAEDASYLLCIIVSVITVILDAIVRSLLPMNPVAAWLISIIIMAAVSVKVFKIPSSNAVMFAVTFLLLRMILIYVVAIFIGSLLR